MTHAPLSLALQRVAAAIEDLGEPTSEGLARALAAPVGAADVAPWVAFDAQNYRRNLVLRRPGFELRVLCWLPRQRTSLHAHARSACAFRVLQGAMTEIRLGAADRRWEVGAVVQEDAGGVVHQIVNLGEEPLVSLHAYAPPLPVDQPPGAYAGRHVVIIGGGVSGVALTIHLLARAGGELRVSVVERRPSLGRGPAYGTSDPAFRLNVPAERMSLLPREPGDFLAWARARAAGARGSDLLPRQLFGAYVEARLAEAVARGRGKVWFCRAEAVAAEEGQVLLSDGTVLRADAVVLATGNQLPTAPPAVAPLFGSPRVVSDPWADAALAAIEPDEDVLLIGTGLTAIDVVLALAGQGHRGRIVATSRHGLLPRPHLAADDPRRLGEVALDLPAPPRSVRGLCSALRAEARAAAARGVGWQRVIDALRPHTAAIWQGLPLAEQRRFMARVRPFWEVLRHRAAGDALAEVEARRASGQLEVIAGQVVAAEERERLALTIERRGGGRWIGGFDRLILCTGPQTDVREWPGALYRGLLRAGALQPDALGLGVVTDASGRAIDARGAPSSWLYTLGGLRRPHLWETTSVPDIVRQAEALAGLLAGEGPRGAAT